MFGASGQNNSSRGGGEATVVPTRFVWPHGGRRVFVCGSFTRWTDHIPMSPMEGCPTVFQVLYNLTPGYHQYKFFVDGEWRHDEHQPFVNGNYGVVNTIFLPRESDVPAFFSPEIPGRSNMDVDNDAFVPLEAVPSISLDDIDVSRHRISTFLSMHTAYELLPESGKVIALDVNLPVRQSFHILHEQGISIAPLWDSRSGRFVGVLSALDFIMILRELGSRGFYLTEEELETHSILAWKEEKMNIANQIDGILRPYQRRLIHAGPYDSLRDVAIKLLQNKISTVPIIHSTSQDGSFPQLLHMASLSGILKCICRNFKHSSGSLPILQQPICSLPLGTWVPKIGDSNGKPLAMLRPNASLNAALSLLVQGDSPLCSQDAYGLFYTFMFGFPKLLYL
ncbi:OLC1v1000426C1 [Oldenlandia corymbosa var. corymbosa]|uniref:OLC1v1000426C1 n=1 Tax=Oldenlandia corymbosa var. corymbosa TaxID=529605 RepID=A0AAV1D2T3_OLDCO|nr:OLC1v1000426C1 [Oldenlandia corymbosa var. corymbosa]